MCLYVIGAQIKKINVGESKKNCVPFTDLTRPNPVRTVPARYILAKNSKIIKNKNIYATVPFFFHTTNARD